MCQWFSCGTFHSANVDLNAAVTESVMVSGTASDLLLFKKNCTRKAPLYTWPRAILRLRDRNALFSLLVGHLEEHSAYKKSGASAMPKVFHQRFLGPTINY